MRRAELAVPSDRGRDREGGMRWVFVRRSLTRKEGDPWPVNIGTMGCPRGETCAGLATRTAPSVHEVKPPTVYGFGSDKPSGAS